MKKIILTLGFGLITCLATAQNTYTSGSTNTSTGNPGQTAPLYNGTNPTGQPNQAPTYSIDPNATKPIVPEVKPITPQPNTTPATPNNPAPITPNTTSPVSPTPPRLEN